MISADVWIPQVVRYAMDLKGVIPNAKGEGTDFGAMFTAEKNGDKIR